MILFKIGDKITVKEETINRYLYLREIRNKTLTVDKVIHNDLSSRCAYYLEGVKDFMFFENELIPVKTKPCKFMEKKNEV